MGALNFDPDWSKHLKHDPDKLLAVDVPVPATKWDDMAALVRPAEAGGGSLKTHDEKLRPPGSMEPSRSIVSVKMKIIGKSDEMNMAMETATTIQEIAGQLAYKLGANPESIIFVSKQGCTFRQMFLHEQVARIMFVKGIDSFSRQPTKWGHPKAVIGAGHIGLKTAMMLMKQKDFDFVVFDRMFRVGGTSWMYQANCTSKLQTEVGSYHLEYDLDNPLPHDLKTPWPSRNLLLAHFDRVAREYGVLPYVRLNTNVKNCEVVERADKNLPAAYRTEYYDLSLEEMKDGMLEYGKVKAVSASDETTEPESFKCSSIMMYPGNLTLPRMHPFKGEDTFDGYIGYAMFNEVDYHLLEGEDVTILGHGAFAVENIRTCVEFGVRQIYLVCRRANLACPRVVSAMSNRSMNPLNNARFMKSMEPMYAFIGKDPWAYHSVQANEKRTTCAINQKARFGIGDIYFLSIYMGKVELIVDKGGIKRLSKETVHLDSGRKLPCKGLLKLLGLVGEMENDRLLKIKEMVGFWVNEDPRRYICAEPVSVMCSQMGGTSMSPGAYAWSVEGIHFIDFPMDFVYGPLASGMLPKHKLDMSDEGTPRPAYVVDARHGSQTAMTVAMYTPALGEKEANFGFIKAVRHRMCHPIKKFLAQAKEDWDYYAKKMLAEGFGVDKPYPDYPYTVKVFREMYSIHMQESGEPVLPCDAADNALCDDA